MKQLSLLFLAALVLTGCERVSVESVPTGKDLVCDKNLTGWWQVESERPDAGYDADESMHLHVSDDCARWVSVEQDNSEQTSIVEDMAVAMHIQLREVGEARYLVVSDRDKSAAGKHDIGEGFEVFRYVAHTDRIDLFEADPRREAHRVADGLVNGRVESSEPIRRADGTQSVSSVNTMITGDGDAIAAWLTRFDPIDRAFMELRRVDEKTQTKLGSHLKIPAFGGKPKPHE